MPLVWRTCHFFQRRMFHSTIISRCNIFNKWLLNSVHRHAASLTPIFDATWLSLEARSSYPKTRAVVPQGWKAKNNLTSAERTHITRKVSAIFLCRILNADQDALFQKRRSLHLHHSKRKRKIIDTIVSKYTVKGQTLRVANWIANPDQRKSKTTTNQLLLATIIN